MKNIFLLVLGALSIHVTAQNVGIGTSTPGVPFHVVKNLPNVEIARFQSNGGSASVLIGNGSAFSSIGHTGAIGYAGTQTLQDFSLRTGGINRLYIKNANGYIGFGTATPISPLDVFADNADFDLARFTGNGGYGQIVVTNGNIASDLGANDDFGYVGSNSDDDFVIRSSGIARMYVKADGNIGIGTNAPSAPLHVKSPNASVDLAMFESNGGTGNILVGNGSGYSLFGHNGNYGYTGTYTPQDFRIMTGYTTRMCFENATGNVGIGTNTPLSRLDVYSGDVDSDIAKFTNPGGYGQILVSNGTITTDLGADALKGYVGTNSDNDFHIRAGGDDVIVLKNGSQYVGIGTSIPECKLNVVSNDPYSDVAIFRNNSGYSSALVSNGSQTLGLAVSPSLCRVGSFTATDFALQTFGQNRLFIQNSTGNVGIGTNTPGSKLHVSGSNLGGSALGNFSAETAENAYVNFVNTTATTKIGSGTDAGFIGTTTTDPLNIMTDNVNRIFIASTGRVGIGTTNPGCTFHVQSNSYDIESARFVNGGGTNQILIGNGTAMVGWALNNQKCWLNNTSAIDFAIQTNSIDRLFVQNGTGNIGIGTSNPTFRLTLRADGSQNLLSFRDINDVPKWHWSIPGDNLNLAESGVADYRFYIQKVTGNVGIGTNTPTTKLEVNGGVKINGALSISSLDVEPVTTVTSFYIPQFYSLGAPYENVNYFKDKEGMIHLSGVVGITGSQTGTIFILPAGYRPAGDQVFACMTSGGTAWRINVNSTGNVTIQGTLSGWVSLSGISFRAI